MYGFAPNVVQFERRMPKSQVTLRKGFAPHGSYWYGPVDSSKAAGHLGHKRTSEYVAHFSSVEQVVAMIYPPSHLKLAN
ncbi:MULTISPECIES: hypothetical protein [unclassified Mesorhizobium]|uniref:hypothetical protein n=1 Tax=unclassified Mesorhizobium TaxID=325217 RepID=UPI001091C42E|nr:MULTISPECIES: hypothetical protein [unclassified Mesorhizobium]TGQ28192.1 hypothetical protein EN857_31815 [Mesorhizobium sp. M4B.F.Ca.ET.214.01.1.1]TGQ55372.1 hypothetical protein EN854_31435 [Mesorhizobium sp. M4B.F.Ca.ET.211.01.1.1]TGU28726.1 hypothetical protein EN793_31660 [Mesorhizobium sp. M4B.F.Ca.ET.150.01.1.1]TIX16345.1 MAG: hypothetical protein E5V46_02960 [Mesorhizobium sp.]